MAIKAAYELPYTGEEVQEMLEQTATNKNLIDGLAASLDDKVDKVAGKDLSTNDYTNEEKAKLSSLENGAQQNVQADWNATSGDAFIKNKPTIPQGVTVDDALSGTSENPVQNKVINNALNGKQSTIADLNDIRSGANAGATAYQKPASGIPKTDLANDVQTSLGKADTALQSYTESDPTVPSHVKAITTTDISNWNGKQNALTFDSTPTAGSNNPVTSAGIKAYVDNATPTITMDDTPTSGSNNPVKSSGIKSALDLKADQSTTYTKTEVDAFLDDVVFLGDPAGSASSASFDAQADTVWNKAQVLSSAQQAQARTNIGVVDVSGTNDGTNWTSITIGSTTKAIPSGGSSGDANVIENITFNGTAATIDSTTKTAAISYTPPVTSVNGNTGAVTLALGDTNVIETVKVNGSALTPDANKAVDITVPSAVTESTVSGWGFTKNTGTITGVTMNSVSKGTSGVVDLGTVITSETPLSKGADSGSGSVVTDVSVSGHTITLTKGNVSGLPSVTSSDNGKILQVESGDWTLVNPVKIYSGTSAPSSAIGNDGDIYLQTLV